MQHVDPHGQLFSLGSPRSYTPFVGRKIKVRFSSIILPTAHSTRYSETAAKILVRKSWTFRVHYGFGTLWFSCPDLSGHRFTCDEDVKRATITWLSQYGHICCVSGMDRLLTHMKRTPAVTGTMWISSVPVIFSLCIARVLIRILPSIYENCKLPISF